MKFILNILLLKYYLFFDLEINAFNHPILCTNPGAGSQRNGVKFSDEYIFLLQTII
jgi:hypothetical protein